MKFTLPKGDQFHLVLIVAVLLLMNGCSHKKSNVHKGYKSINGTKIYYETMGSASHPALLILHGKPLLNSSYLKKPLRPLASNYHLVFFDQRLSGHSSDDVKPSKITLQTYVNDIEALRKALKLEDIYLMGHAWGGFLSMKYALQYPQHLNKLILADPIPARSEVWHEEQVALRTRATMSYRKKQRQILSAKKYKNDKTSRTKALMRLRLSKQFHNSTYADSLKLYIPPDFAKRSRLFGNLMPALQHYNLYPKLKTLQVPTLIIYGADEAVAKVSGTKMNETIPHSTLKIIPQAGHFPFIEQQDKFLKAIRSFLEH